jgi:hypothetical protein
MHVRHRGAIDGNGLADSAEAGLATFRLMDHQATRGGTTKITEP